MNVPNTPSSSPIDPALAAGDQSMAVLSQIQGQIDAFGKLYAQTSERAAQLELLTAQLNARQDELAAEAARQREERERLEALLREAEALRTQKTQIEGLIEQARTRQGDLEAARQTLEREKQLLAEQLDAQSRELDEQRRRVEAREAEAQQKLAHADEDRRQLDQRQEALAMERARQEAAAAEAEAQRTAAMDALAEAYRQRDALETERQTLLQRVSEAERAAASGSAQGDEARRRAQTLGEELAGLGAQLEEARARAGTAGAQAEDARAQSAELRREVEAASHLLAEAQRLADDARGRAEALGIELDRVRAEGSAALLHAQGEAAAAAGRLEEALARGAALEREIADQREHARALAQRAEAAEAEVGSLRARIAELAARKPEPAAAGGADDEAARQARDEVDQLTTELAQARRALDQREEALRVLAQRLLGAEEQSVAHGGQLQSLRDQLAAASAAADAANARADELEAALRQAGEAGEADRSGEGSARVDLDEPRLPAPLLAGEAGWIQLRRERLGLYKRLLQNQSRKIVAAKAALQKRTAEAEQVVAQRGRLAELATALQARERSISARAARNHAGVLVACASVTLLVVAVLSWGISGRVAPATYAATAEIAAEARARGATAEELDAWTATHEELLTDPRVMSAAAENFARRGHDGLSSAAAVKQRMDRELYHTVEQPGRVRVELRGQGRERTERDLETYLSALLTVANAQRDLRGDGAATIIAQRPTAGAEALDHTRLYYWLGIAGGGVFGSLIIGLIAYRLLAQSKARFEQEHAMIEAAV